MTIHAVELESQPKHRSFRMTRPTAPAVASQVRPAIILPDREARTLLHVAEREDVSRGGCFSAGPAGVQVWSGPWDGAGGSRGTSEHLGSVDWSYDTPNRHYITVYRVLVTVKGVASGFTPADILRHVLELAGLTADAGVTLAMEAPPARDPFRSSARQDMVGALR
ncbi:MAG: hypothetical protein JWN88_1156 [Frankiales bacterium]|nr:hypothetical protein [Frankiales bacterium]